MQRKGDSIKPYIKDDSGKEGWDVIKPQLDGSSIAHSVKFSASFVSSAIAKFAGIAVAASIADT